MIVDKRKHSVAIVQARMSSRRLPGKVLREIDGKPLLGYLVDSLQNCNRLAAIVVATSNEESDSAIVEFCKQNGIRFFCGSLEDVASRYLSVAQIHDLDSFVRISGDSPLIDPLLVDYAVGTFLNNDYDVVTNLFPRTYPPGMSVEVIKARVFSDAIQNYVSAEQKEHVTSYFYENTNVYSIWNIESNFSLHPVSLAVDTMQDFEIMTRVIQDMDKDVWRYTIDEKLSMYVETHRKYYKENNRKLD